MPRIIVTTEAPKLLAGARVLLDEEVRSVHLDTSHAASQLVQRLAWAISDAETAEHAPAARRSGRLHDSLPRALAATPSTAASIGA